MTRTALSANTFSVAAIISLSFCCNKKATPLIISGVIWAYIYCDTFSAAEVGVALTILSNSLYIVAVPGPPPSRAAFLYHLYDIMI